MPLLHALGWLLGMWPVPQGTSPLYQFFSGSCLILMACASYYRRINCHVRYCPFVGRFDVAGGQFKLCGRHSQHPRRITREYIMTLHAQHVSEVNHGRPASGEERPRDADPGQRLPGPHR